jgi:hypothetical protein
VRGFGNGSKLWRAEVVLRVPEPDASRNQQRLVEAVAAVTTALDADAVPRVSDIAPTWSYDMQPPHPDSGVGVACWVLADTVGEAAQEIWEVVEAAARTFSTEASLWDLRVIPREAILSAPSTGTPLPSSARSLVAAGCIA